MFLVSHFSFFVDFGIFGPSVLGLIGAETDRSLASSNYAQIFACVSLDFSIPSLRDESGIGETRSTESIHVGFSCQGNGPSRGRKSRMQRQSAGLVGKLLILILHPSKFPFSTPLSCPVPGNAVPLSLLAYRRRKHTFFTHIQSRHQDK